MRYFTWKLELVSDILWMVVAIVKASFKVCFTFVVCTPQMFDPWTSWKLWKTKLHLMKIEKFHILLLFGNGYSWKTKTTLDDLFQKLHIKKKSAKRLRSLLILNVFQILNNLFNIYLKQFRCTVFKVLYICPDACCIRFDIYSFTLYIYSKLLMTLFSN